jgi:hypothetical protein
MDTPAQARARDRLDGIVTDELAGEHVDQGRMFSTVGWRSGGRVFAFIGRGGELVLKLPEERVAELVATDAVSPMTLGVRTMREWVRVGDDVEGAPLVREAHAFVAGSA